MKKGNLALNCAKVSRQHPVRRVSSRPEKYLLAVGVARERTSYQGVSHLDDSFERETDLGRVGHSEPRHHAIQQSVGYHRVVGALGGRRAKVDDVTYAKPTEPGLGAERVSKYIERAGKGSCPVGVPGIDGLIGHAGQYTLKVSGTERLEQRDSIGEVAVDGTDRRAGAIGNHGRREPLEADIGHDCRSGIQQRGESRGASRLDGCVPEGNERLGQVFQRVGGGHGNLLRLLNYIVPLGEEVSIAVAKVGPCENGPMCGRFVVAGANADLVALFDVDLPADDLPAPSWNVAPTDRVAIVLDALPKDPLDELPVRRLESARWGLVPSWAKDPKAGVTAINARIETLTEKPHFTTAVRKRRALVPATGYYEWHTTPAGKTPHFIHLAGGELFVFAGLYEWWRNPAAADDSSDKWLLSTTIITREATGALRRIHDRMPVFLQPELIDDWLDPRENEPNDLLDAISAGGVEVAARAQFYEVGRAVGNVRNNSPELIAPVE